MFKKAIIALGTIFKQTPKASQIENDFYSIQRQRNEGIITKFKQLQSDDILSITVYTNAPDLVIARYTWPEEITPNRRHLDPDEYFNPYIEINPAFYHTVKNRAVIDMACKSIDNRDFYEKINSVDEKKLNITKLNYSEPLPFNSIEQEKNLVDIDKKMLSHVQNIEQNFHPEADITVYTGRITLQYPNMLFYAISICSKPI